MSIDTLIQSIIPSKQSSEMLPAIIVSIFYICAVLSEPVIYSGQGFGTHYYDVKNPEIAGFNYTNQNKGFVGCSPQNALSLNQIDSNMLVAMNNTQMKEDMGRYCGKRVVVSVNGQESDRQLFIGDGCERCANGASSGAAWNPNGVAGLDFSFEIFMELSQGQAYHDGNFAITWKILEERIYNFNYSNLASPNASASPTTALNTCLENEWKCRGNVLEQCVSTAWLPRATCPLPLLCLGGSQPYCGPA